MPGAWPEYCKFTRVACSNKLCFKLKARKLGRRVPRILRPTGQEIPCRSYRPSPYERSRAGDAEAELGLAPLMIGFCALSRSSSRPGDAEAELELSQGAAAGDAEAELGLS